MREPITVKDITKDVIGGGFSGLMVVGDVHSNIDGLNKAIKLATGRLNLFMVFLGDIIDYGNHPWECVNKVTDIVLRGNGSLVRGNHDNKEFRRLSGNKIEIKGGIQNTYDEWVKWSPEKQEAYRMLFCEKLYPESAHIITCGNAVFTHGAITRDFWDGIISGRQHDYSMFGQIDNNLPKKKDGFPNRIYQWARHVPKNRLVMVGHDIRDTRNPVDHVETHEHFDPGHVWFMDTGSSKDGVMSGAQVCFEPDDHTMFVKKTFTF